MLNAFRDGFHALFNIDLFTTIVLLCLVLACHWLVKVMTDSVLMAAAFTPVLFLGGLVSNYVFKLDFLVLLDDKQANTVAALSAGVLGGMLLTFLIVRVGFDISDWNNRSRRAKRVLPTS